MHRIALFIVGFILLLSACTQRLTCPAFQSAYIYDKEAVRKKFSYFNEDSTPKILTASKNKYLIAIPESYRKKVRSLKTVEMIPVYPEIPDSLKTNKDADLIMVEHDFSDSTAIQEGGGSGVLDSTYAITKIKEKFNVDQDNYMWYFRDVLVMPDVRAALDQKKGSSGKEAGAAGTDEPKKKGGLRGLFNRKKGDSTSNAPTIPLNGSDMPGATGGKKTKQPKSKKIKKQKSKVNTNDEVKKDVPTKKEEEDDGFR